MPSVRAKRLVLLLLVFFFPASLASAGQNRATSERSWSGTLVSSACNADEAFNEAPACSKTISGAKVALYDDTTRVMYDLDPQEKVTGHLGDSVTVRGVLDEETIHLISIEPMSIGLAVGQKAPAFSMIDQFGHVQTLDSLKGSRGTVLLFFRSADW